MLLAATRRHPHAKLLGVPVEVSEGVYPVVSCKLKEFVVVGDQYLYICYVDKMLGDEETRAAFAWNGHARITSAKIAE